MRDTERDRESVCLCVQAWNFCLRMTKKEVNFTCIEDLDLLRVGWRLNMYSFSLCSTRYLMLVNSMNLQLGWLFYENKSERRAVRSGSNQFL